MGMQVFGQIFDSGELSSAAMFQPIKFNENISLKAVRTQILIIDNPTFTSLNMKLFSDRSGLPQKLMATSTNVQTKAAIHTDDHALKEIWFQFADISLNSSDRYHFVLNGTGYVPSATAFIAWRKGFPDPIYELNIASLQPKDIGCLPFALAPIAHII